jgi:hypothetical protein
LIGQFLGFSAQQAQKIGFPLNVKVQADFEEVLENLVDVIVLGHRPQLVKQHLKWQILETKFCMKK